MLINCRECQKEVSSDAKTCPHCGIKKPYEQKATITQAVIALGLVIWAVVSINSCEPSKPKVFDLTDQGVKTLSSDIIETDIKPPVIKIKLNKDPFTGGAQDWNSVASTTKSLSSDLFAKQEINRITLEFWSPGNQFTWAKVAINRADLPEKWQDITYLEFFGKTKPDPESKQSYQWLCEFYEKYSSVGQSCQP